MKIKIGRRRLWHKSNPFHVGALRCAVRTQAVQKYARMIVQIHHSGRDKRRSLFELESHYRRKRAAVKLDVHCATSA